MLLSLSLSMLFFFVRCLPLQAALKRWPSTHGCSCRRFPKGHICCRCWTWWSKFWKKKKERERANIWTKFEATQRRKQNKCIPLHSSCKINFSAPRFVGAEDSNCLVVRCSAKLFACWRIIHVQPVFKENQFSSFKTFLLVEFLTLPTHGLCEPSLLHPTFSYQKCRRLYLHFPVVYPRQRDKEKNKHQ